MDPEKSENNSSGLVETVTAGGSDGSEQIETGKPNYYEKNGLRTGGDGVDHYQYNTRSIGFIMTVLGSSFALAGSQIATLLYLTLGTVIAVDLDATKLTVWMFTSIIIAVGTLAPFVGPLADLYGRKPVLLFGLVCSITGSIVCAATPNAAGFIGGQVVLGFGAVIQELLSLSVVSEIVPTAKRSLYAALILCSIIPWSPGTLYANWMADYSWRWIGCALGIWNLMTLVIIAWFYRPPPRVNSLGLSKRELLGRIDFIGGGLVTAGLLFFLIALNWGGQDFPWKSARVLSFLIVGIGLLITFGLWEAFGARYPLFPRRIIHAPRPFFCILFVIFTAGINYIPLVVFWPIQSISVYGSNLHQSGINTLPIGMGILGGGIVSALLIGIFKRHVRVVMTFFCIMQTVAAACLTLADPHDVKTALIAATLALIGVGGVIVPNQVILTVITPDDLIASVTALSVGLRAQAQVVGLAIFYNRFITEVTKNATPVVVTMIGAGVFDIAAIEEFITSLTAIPFSELAPTIPELLAAPYYEIVKEATIQCFSKSFTLIYYITIAFGVSACIAAALIGDVSQYMDDHVAVVL